ncbi:hypothetical protein DESC_370146 [Desulfosarcina cetonica]|nr:hypothetical protein DESC_370146 [Desulfosarcina cetonica]
MMLVGCVDDVFVDFVGDDEGIEFLGQIGDDRKLRQGEDLARRIGRVAQHDGLGLLREGGAQLVFIEVEIRRMQRHVDGIRAAENRVGAVILVKRREDHHLVAGIAGGHHGRHHRLGTAAGDHDVGIGVEVEPHPMALLAGQGFAKAQAAPGDRVLVGAVVHGALAGGEDFRRWIGVGKPLGEVDGIVLVGHAGHFADDRFGEMGQTVGDLRHGSSRQRG